MRPDAIRVTGNDLGLDYRKPRAELLAELIDQMGMTPGAFAWMHQEVCRRSQGPCTCVPDLVAWQSTLPQ